MSPSARNQLHLRISTSKEKQRCPGDVCIQYSERQHPEGHHSGAWNIPVASLGKAACAILYHMVLEMKPKASGVLSFITQFHSQPQGESPDPIGKGGEVRLSL